MTPLMKQYHELKSQATDALLMFRMGDFYELFGPDAVTASQVLGITLTSRDKNKENALPMAGVPHHSAENYIQKLLKSGFKVAIAEQTEDPATVAGKGIVKREILREFSPAIQFSGLEMENHSTAWIAMAIPAMGHANHCSYVLAALNPATGESFISEKGMTSEDLVNVFKQYPIKHMVAHPDLSPEIRTRLRDVLGKQSFWEEFSTPTLSVSQAESLLSSQYGVKSLSAFLKEPDQVLGLGVLLKTVLRSQRISALGHLRPPKLLGSASTLRLGPDTWRHLDLDELLKLVDSTQTAVGSRKLGAWMRDPLKFSEDIRRRQEGVRECSSSPISELKFSGFYDLERICGRIHTGLASPRDTLALGKSLLFLKEFPKLKTKSAWLNERMTSLTVLSPTLAALGEKIYKAQSDPAPHLARDGGVFSRGYSDELDRLIDLTEKGERFLIELEERERAATQIGSLKVRYNRVFGYYIEITQAHLAKVPAHYHRKQTMVGAERFFTDELKKFEEEILTAEGKRKKLESELFEGLMGEIRAQSKEILEFSDVISDLDAAQSLARLFTRANPDEWSWPTIKDAPLSLEIERGAHPVLLAKMGGDFVPNSVSLSEKSPVLLISGPNMGGKSTIMRQTAQIVLLGQMGGPVPAQSASWGACDAIFTRIGAQDLISQGQSTFMVEMTELAHMLHHSTEKSLLILDEIGRGTSTYDGISVAWATLEWIAEKIGARTMFATHFHELTHEFSGKTGAAKGVVNAHLSAEPDHHSGLRFLYRLETGPASESFGIAVASLAGIPKPVITRAWEVLQKLEREPTQLTLFQQDPRPTPPAQEISQGALHAIKALENIECDTLTPKLALDLIYRLKADIRS